MTEYDQLLNPHKPGVHRIKGFLGNTTLGAIGDELADPSLVQWKDTHGEVQRIHSTPVRQNFDSFAVKLSRGDQSIMSRIPNTSKTIRKISTHIHDMSAVIRTLRTWTPDEASIHRYDDSEVGISYHRDNLRFIGLIAIVSLDGVADIAVKQPNATVIRSITTQPGDLILLRAPGLIETTDDLRPEHAVMNLQTPTRTSLMVRANNRPDEAIPGFSFVNWP